MLTGRTCARSVGPVRRRSGGGRRTGRPARMFTRDAIILDARPLAAAIRAELTERVAKLAARGIVPGLATVLWATTQAVPSTSQASTGTAPRSASQPPPRPAAPTAHPAAGRGRLSLEAQRQSRMHWVHRASCPRLPPVCAASRAELMDPARTPTACTDEPRRLVLGEPPAACHVAARASSGCSRRVPVADRGGRRHVIGRRRHRRTAARAAVTRRPAEKRQWTLSPHRTRRIRRAIRLTQTSWWLRWKAPTGHGQT